MLEHEILGVVQIERVRRTLTALQFPYIWIDPQSFSQGSMNSHENVIFADITLYHATRVFGMPDNISESIYEDFHAGRWVRGTYSPHVEKMAESLPFVEDPLKTAIAFKGIFGEVTLIVPERKRYEERFFDAVSRYLALLS